MKTSNRIYCPLSDTTDLYTPYGLYFFSYTYLSYLSVHLFSAVINNLCLISHHINKQWRVLQHKWIVSQESNAHRGPFFSILWFLDMDIGSSTCAGILEHSMGVTNREGTGLSYRPASLCSLAGRYDNPAPTWFLATHGQCWNF